MLPNPSGPCEFTWVPRNRRGWTYGTGDSGVIVVSNRRSEITRRSRSVYTAARLWVRGRRIKWRQRTAMARTQGARVTASVPPCRAAPTALTLSAEISLGQVSSASEITTRSTSRYGLDDGVIVFEVRQESIKKRGSKSWGAFTPNLTTNCLWKTKSRQLKLALKH